MVIRPSILVLWNNNKNMFYCYIILCLLMTISPSMLGLLNNNNKDKIILMIMHVLIVEITFKLLY